MRTLRRACTPAVAAALAIAPLPAVAADRIVLQLDGAPAIEAAGYLAAERHGFYRDAGLDVEIRPGTQAGPAPTDPVREVTEGRAQFGTGDVNLLVRAAQGLPLLLLAPIFQESGVRIYYRADGDFSTPAALAGARVGRPPPSHIRDVELRSMLAAEAVDPEKLRSVTLQPDEIVDRFQKHEIDAAIGSEWDLPWQAKEKGVALRAFDPAQYRAAFYGKSLFTLQRTAQLRPDEIRAFRAASLKGWEYAFRHPDEVLDRLQKMPPETAVSDPAGFARYQSAIAAKLAHFPGVALGASNPERWRHIQESLLAAGAMARPADLDTVVFIPGAAAAREGGGQGGWQLGAGIAAALVAAAALFGWRWRRHAAGIIGAGADGRPQRISARYAAALADELRAVAEAVAAPLDRLRGQAELQPRVARACAAATDALDRLRAIARRLALTAAPQAIDPRPSDLNAALTALARPIRQSLPGGVNFRFSLLPEPWLCEADPDAVAGVVLDVVAAAGAAVPAGGEVIVGTRHFAVDADTAGQSPGAVGGDYVRVTVRDSGNGLSQDRLDRVFDPERTGDPAICTAATLARRLGGFARVESAEGLGTAVHLFFRRSPDPAADTAEDEPPARAAE